jgi:hypothetical protein
MQQRRGFAAGKAPAMICARARCWRVDHPLDIGWL